MDTPEAKTENFELPTPSAGAGEMAQATPEKGAAPEQKAAPAASSQSDAAYSMPTGTPAATDPAAATAASTPPVANATGSTHPLAADDADLIEKTWVEKAKQIVAETRGDPYKQNNEINKVKADYIKKRYNKDIKLAGE